MDAAGPRGLPRLDLLRQMSEQTVFSAVVAGGATTRAELAERTGISKPTVSQAVRRLEGAGLLAESGTQAGRRGRVGTLYDVPVSAGVVLAVALDQSGIRTRTADLAGRTVSEDRAPLAGGGARRLAGALRTAVATAGDSSLLRAVCVSVANPVDPTSGRVMPLPDAPFPEGRLQPTEVLAGRLRQPLVVDNDVNLTALAEQREGAAVGVRDFVFVYLGAGLGGAVVVDGTVRAGRRGYAGEVGYLPTALTGRSRTTLLRHLAQHAPSAGPAPALDVDRVLALLDGRPSARRTALVDLLGSTCAYAAAALGAALDPHLVLLGGPLGAHPSLLTPFRAAVAELWPLGARTAPSALGPDGPLIGAAHRAVDVARADALARLAAES